MLPEDRNIPTVNTLIGPVARGSVLHKPCSFKDFKWLAQILSPPVLQFLTSHQQWMKEVIKVVMFVPKGIQILLMVILPTTQKILLTVTPGIPPLNQSVSPTVLPAKVSLIFLYYPTNVVRKLLTWIYFLMLQTFWIRFKYPFKQQRSFTPRQLVKQITMYDMRRETPYHSVKVWQNFEFWIAK